MDWLISANSHIYDHKSSFDDYNFIDWKQKRYRFEINDIVYIYETAPSSKIQYKTKINKLNMSFSEIRDDKKYWKNLKKYEESLSGKFMRLVLIDRINTPKLSLNELKKNGLLNAPQGPIKLHGPLLKYIEDNFTGNNQNNIFPEMVSEDEEIYEGAKKQITVSKYERNHEAREKCIEYNGIRCKICNIDFSEIYGSIGNGFIHIHHKIPISEIGETYKIDYKNDLIPVCPNCHAMLHRKKEDGTVMTISELKDLYKKNKK